MTSNIDNPLRIQYFKGGMVGGKSNCHFKFIIPTVIHEDVLIVAKDWIDEKLEELTSAYYSLNRIVNEDELIYVLQISGRGHDSRCTWCRSFRTVLINKFTDYGVPVEQEARNCKYPFHDCER